MSTPEKKSAPLPAIDPVLLAGTGPQILAEAARLTGRDGAEVLREIVGTLLVQKGADWTAPILADYVGLYDQSLVTFVLAWDRVSQRLVAHGAMFQSRLFPQVGLVAHIRTDDRCKGLGLGTRITERVLQAGFDRGAQAIVLETNDKLRRVETGERSAKGMYARLGFAVLAEKRMPDTVDWLMVTDRESFAGMLRSKAAHGGKLPAALPEAVTCRHAGMVDALRAGYARPAALLPAQPVGNGDVAALFLLFNLCPPDDFRVKLSAWNIHFGPELEREFVVHLRPAAEDRDRVEDASRTLRDPAGRIVAVCAAKLDSPFTRRTYRLDFYCLPDFLRVQPGAIRELAEQTLAGLPRPTRLAFWGVDEEKIAVFSGLGFVAAPGRMRLVSPLTGTELEAREYVRELT